MIGRFEMRLGVQIFGGLDTLLLACNLPQNQRTVIVIVYESDLK